MPLALLGSAMVVAACDIGGSRRVACPTPTMSLTDTAAVAYVGSVEPLPMRFLIATSEYGDSALPEPAVAGIRSKGPSYFYPPDPTRNAPVRERLVRAGPFPALLVFYHGMEVHGDTAADFTFSGSFVTGNYDGTVAPHHSVRMVCADGRWQLASRVQADTGTTS
ncbi:MAG TPA: hypothetical protein VMM18_02220 [Gemmatimonadaceae bacterium]|nr:hypothetical protein [Gemmatimonadaceae bacterium]